MWVIPGMTTAPTPSLIELLSPSHFVSFPAKQQVLCDWQYRNPLGALFPLNNFTSNMSSPFRAHGYDNEHSRKATIDPPPGLGLVNDPPNDPSYRSDPTEWPPEYHPALYDTQPAIYAQAPYISSEWNQQLSAMHGQPMHAAQQQRYSYADETTMYPVYPIPTTSAAPMPSSSAPTVPSPHLSLPALSPGPHTPATLALSVGNSPNIQPATAVSNSPQEPARGIYTHRQQQQFFREALSLPIAGVSGPFVPQQMYKPHTNSDRRRYVEEIELDAPIFFWMTGPDECGIPLSDALHSRVKRLRDRDVAVFEGRGPSVSIRLEWPGYRQWSRQIPTKDFRSPPGPITLAKLAKNVAKCVQRFIEDRQHSRLEDDADPAWRVGLSGPRVITLDDIILVSMYHVSLGSWQPQLRLKLPLNQPSHF
ncbi:hypothetical protein Agabi119p4_6460 [Agaricus bisporus var. burnettii]|uniref:Uncharacterized protein n=2 Tax=Agaricus bisporus var. burnettii TaxID=192524 RepID=A0A8H7C998_AGABI|nr:hypothetical protein Agabi119p4_6460 [Agaricus bisporus var. burnettii]